MPGARVPDVTASLTACAVRDDVRRVILHVGGNDIHKQYSAQDLETDFKELVAEVTHVFPQPSQPFFQGSRCATFSHQISKLGIASSLCERQRQVYFCGGFCWPQSQETYEALVLHWLSPPQHERPVTLAEEGQGVLVKVRASLYWRDPVGKVLKNTVTTTTQQLSVFLRMLNQGAFREGGQNRCYWESCWGTFSTWKSKQTNTHSPGCWKLQEITATQSLARNNMHPMPVFHPSSPFPHYRAGLWPDPFFHRYPRPQQGSFEGVY